MQKNNKLIKDKLTFPALLKRNALLFPDRRAQWWIKNNESRSITYRELDKIVRNISCGLMDSGFEKGDRAAIFSPTNPCWMWADYGILSAGGITVCIYPSLSSTELASQINDSGSKIIFVDDNIMYERILSVWNELKNPEKVVLFKGGAFIEDDHVTNLKKLRKSGEEFDRKNPGAFEARRDCVKLDDYMSIAYTSGTTGKPKGVVHTHRSMNTGCIRDLDMIPPVGEKDVLLSFLPLAHTFERQCGHGVAMMSGAAIAYSSPHTLADDLKYFRPTFFMGVPRIFKRIYSGLRDRAASSFIFNSGIKTGLKVLEKNKALNGFVDMTDRKAFLSGSGPLLKLKYKFFDIILFSKIRKILGGRLRFCFSASATLPAEICSFFLAMGVKVLEGYGSTETCNTITLNRIDSVLPGSVGYSCTGVEGRMSREGEWLVKGDNIFSCYWNNEEETLKSFDSDGYYKTGDIVEYAKDNYLKIIDRKKGLIVLDTGKKVASAKIESLFALSKFIDIVVPYGNDRKILTALIFPNFDEIKRFFEKSRIYYEKDNMIYEDGVCVEVGRNFINNEKLLEIIDNEITEANSKLESWEKIKKYYISSRRLTEKTGELTPSFKVKRNIVFRNFKRELESLYHGIP